MGPRVRIDCHFETLPADAATAHIVAVDVIRSTTTAITAVASGRRCIVVGSIDEAVHWKTEVPDAILVGELGGNMPFGFDLNNSPAALAQRTDRERPAILLSTSGTRLMADAARRPGAGAATSAACLRNWTAQADALIAGRPDDVLLLGAGTRGEFREEDQACCAWIASRLIGAGFTADPETFTVIDRWAGAPVARIADGKSAAYLRDSGQALDLEFILDHVDDIAATFAVVGNDVVAER